MDDSLSLSDLKSVQRNILESFYPSAHQKSDVMPQKKDVSMNSN